MHADTLESVKRSRGFPVGVGRAREKTSIVCRFSILKVIWYLKVCVCVCVCVCRNGLMKSKHRGFAALQRVRYSSHILNICLCACSPISFHWCC